MSRIEGKQVNWTNLEKESSSMELVQKLPPGEYDAHLHKLSQEQEVLVDEVKALYHTNPSSELYSVITLLEQVDREFKKLK